MIRELLYELYSDQRLIIGSGAVLTVYIASVLFHILDPERPAERLSVALSPLSSVGCAVCGIYEIICSRIKGKRERVFSLVFAACLGILAITSSGTGIFSQQLAGPAVNDMHIPDHIVAAMSAVLDDSNAAGGERAVVLTMPGWDTYFECYSPVFELPCRNASNEISKIRDEDDMIIRIELSKTSPDMKKVARIAHLKGCRYVVLTDDCWPDTPITDLGYEELAQCKGCTVYREVSTP